MRHTLFALVVLALSLPAFAADPTPVKLQAGEHTQLDVAGLTRLAIGDPIVADVKVVGGTTFEIDARCPGKTTLLAWGDQAPYAFQIEVTGTAKDPAACEGKAARSQSLLSGRTVKLAAGESTTLEAPTFDRLVTTEPRIAHAQTQEGKVRIDARTPGKTAVILLRDGGLVEAFTVEVH